MIIIKDKSKKEKYFSRDVSFSDILKRVVYIQSVYNQPIIGFIYQKKFTKIIKLKDDFSLIMDFKSTTRNEIRKATKEGVKFLIEKNILSFVDFYNDFANSIGLKKITNYDIEKFGDNFIITKAIYNDKVLTMHSYFFDDEIKRARLLHSASLHNNIEDKKERALIGRANRFLHFEDMNYFYKRGFKIYDLGGYAYKTTDKHLQNINKFKDSFGGELEENSNYIPIWLYYAGKLKKALKW